MLGRFTLIRLFLFVALCSAPALADDAPVRAPTANVSLLGGLVARQGLYAFDPQLNDIAGGTSWASVGPTPTFFRLRADGYFLRWLGIEGDLLIDHSAVRPADEPQASALSQTRFTGRGAVALRAFFDSGFHFGGSLGWAALAIPILSYPANATTVVSQSVLTHGPSARLGIGLTRGVFDASLNVQATVAVGTGQGLALDADLFAGWRFFEGETTAMTAGLDYGVLLEGGTGYAALNQRLTIGLKLSFLPPRNKRDPNLLGPQASRLEISVLLPDGSPAAGAKVRLDQLATTGTTDATGQLISNAPAGRYTLTAALDGFREGRTDFAVRIDEPVTPVTIRLEALAGPGSLSGVVTAASSRQPVEGAQVTIEGAKGIATAATGAFTFKSAGPGPVRVRIEAQGFATVEEVVQVPAERAATLDVALEALGKGSPATVRGLIRSRNGDPISAQVTIKGVAVKVPVTAEGRFVVTLKGGTYSFVISAPGYLPQTKKVVLADGDQAIFHSELLKVAR